MIDRKYLLLLNPLYNLSGHCKTLAPVYEEVAQELTGVVNVARVDVMQNRELGTRFDVKGFPTIKLFSKGHVYTYKGKRTTQDLVEFARGGYQLHEPQAVPGELGYFGEIILVYKHAYKQASKDLLEGNYFTASVLLMLLPVIFGILLLLIIVIPFSSPQERAMLQAQEQARARAAKAQKKQEIPVSSRARPPTSAVDSHNGKSE
jgi:thiol-disulfide isomerase/thioredoxin